MAVMPALLSALPILTYSRFNRPAVTSRVSAIAPSEKMTALPGGSVLTIWADGPVSAPASGVA
jgi:hypothetical protein